MPTHRTPLLPIFLILAITTALPSAVADEPQSESITFELFPANSNMGRTNLIHDETATARPVMMKEGVQIFQVLIHKSTGRELFRVKVGTTEATYWVYGLVREADFNGDGIPDFSWHGGDDVSELNLAVLSSKQGYRKMDVEASLRNEWRHRFPSDPGENNLLQDPVFSDMKLLRTSGKLQLQGTIRFSEFSASHGVKEHERHLRVQEQNFVYVK